MIRENPKREERVILFGKSDCHLCKLTARRFEKWGIPFTVRFIDGDYRALAEYCFFLGRKLEPELPMIVVEGKEYSRSEAYKILNPQRRSP